MKILILHFEYQENQLFCTSHTIQMVGQISGKTATSWEWNLLFIVYDSIICIITIGEFLIILNKSNRKFKTHNVASCCCCCCYTLIAFACDNLKLLPSSLQIEWIIQQADTRIVFEMHFQTYVTVVLPTKRK